jgi:signal transduction histidine kinase
MILYTKPLIKMFMEKKAQPGHNLAILKEISEKLFSKRNIKAILPLVFSLAEELLQAAAGIMFLDRETPGILKYYLHNRSNTSFIDYQFLRRQQKKLKRREPAIINDYQRHADSLPDLVKCGVTGIISCPMTLNKKQIGSLSFFSLDRKTIFDDQDLTALQIIAQTMAQAIEHRLSRRQYRLSKRAIDAVLHANPALNASLDLQRVLSSLLTAALDLAPGNRSHIFLYNRGHLSFGAALDKEGKTDTPYSNPRENGLTYTVARSGKTKIIPDMKNDPLFKNAPKDWHGSIVSIPLKTGERVVGVMNISRPKPGPFTKDAIRIWNLFSNQAAIAIENARLFEAERKQNERIEALRSAVTAINSSLDISDVLDFILTELRRVIPYDSASIMLTDGDRLRVVGGRDLPDGEIIGKTFPSNELDQEIAATRKPLIIEDAREDERFLGWGGTGYVRGWLSVPLISKEKMIGYITIDSRSPGAFSQDDAEIATSFAYEAAMAVENATLHKNLKDKLRDLQESRDQLLQSEKLAAIGRLVAGVAHELNNPLTSIIGIAQILQTYEVNREISDYLESLVKEAHRTANIVRSLLDFARQHKPKKEVIEIHQILKSVVDILAYDLRSNNINLVTDFSPDVPSTMADPHKLQQVFVNLITNAKQAIVESKEKAQITVITQTGASLYFQKKHNREKVIRIIIKDNGPGIPTAALPHVFDPFYTTKPIGGGTGLGLAVCHGIIKEHGGYMWVESTEGKGAAFHIELPVINPDTYRRSDHL